MYSFQYEDALTEHHWEIIDPHGDTIAIVYSLTEAEALISHLNRGLK